MKNAILAALLLSAVTTPALAQNVPEHYQARTILTYCGGDISRTKAEWIQENYFRFKLLKGGLVNAAYKAYKLGGDEARLRNYCNNLVAASEDLRR